MKTDASSLGTVHLASIGIEIAPDVITSDALEDQLAPAWSAMGIEPGQLEHLTGVRERRWWPAGTSISRMAALACQKALDSANLPASIIGQLANTDRLGVIPQYRVQHGRTAAASTDDVDDTQW